MNLGHAIGSSVRESVRETPSTPLGFWHEVGSIAVERVRTFVETLDLVEYEAWKTQDDERTCPICGALDGRVWLATEGFVPPVHDHCRCERVHHHTESRSRMIEQWQDAAVPRVTWEWRTR